MAALLDLEARLDNLLATAQKETADFDLYAPITERRECPICMLPLPLGSNETTFMNCCGKFICQGCMYKGVVTNLKNGTPQDEIKKCVFCRQLPVKNVIKALKKLIKRNNALAYIQMAGHYIEGEGVFQSDTKSLELIACAAELGEVEAFSRIGSFYLDGTAVEEDISKAVEIFEVGAKKGSISAHQRLAEFHGINENIQDCIEHTKVAASAGDQIAMDNLMANYKVNKLLSKEDLSQTLLAFQTSRNEMKNKERDDAIAFQSTWR